MDELTAYEIENSKHCDAKREWGTSLRIQNALENLDKTARTGGKEQMNLEWR